MKTLSPLRLTEVIPIEMRKLKMLPREVSPRIDVFTSIEGRKSFARHVAGERCRVVDGRGKPPDPKRRAGVESPDRIE
jgi:hypothetical protein